MNSGTSKKGIFYTKFDSISSNDDTLLVFLHGLGSSQNFYFGIARTISSNFSCLILDNKGSGRSELTTLSLTIESLSDDVQDLLIDLNLITKKLVLIGHSMSAMVVHSLIKKYDRELKILKAILINPVYPSHNMIEVFDSRITFLRAKNSMVDLANMVSLNAVGSKCSNLKRAFIRELILAQVPQHYIATCGAIIDASKNTQSAVNYYSNMNVETLLILGKEDKTSPYKDGSELIVNVLTRKKCVFLDGVGHWACIEDPDEVCSQILSFL